MRLDEKSPWCDKCGFHVGQQWIEEQECPFFECPLEKPRVVDVGDDLHRILSAALTQQEGGGA